ncbi:hypothetical protein LVD17_24020 [Fulvivirga ulvae]|uniref:contractile injection system tape measure protein n=1 Tax=Fulvivirga ulvae TaxID=2904245 RepID=UPI001EEE125A|nr:contractile injection system tape measure protein [Fulvivirga ulvae]UII31364.1 hypothetical protein LVD17_24020 [Fulvivirga ulvae]
MLQKKHIVNRQVLEMRMPKEKDVFTTQRKIGDLYREKLVPIIDRQLSDRFSKDDIQYQIAQLTIDLGQVRLEEIEEVFAKKFAQALAAHQPPEEHKQENETTTPDRTPLRVVSYYLMNGILPWWADNASLTYLHQQLNELLQHPENAFKGLISQLRYNVTYLNRFLNTFTEVQTLQSLALLTTVDVSHLHKTKNEFVRQVKQHAGEWSRPQTDRAIAKAFWTAAFGQITTAKDYEGLERTTISSALTVLGADQQVTNQWQGTGKTVVNRDQQEVQLLVRKLQKKHPENITWQRFFQHFSAFLQLPSFQQVRPAELIELRKLMKALDGGEVAMRPHTGEEAHARIENIDTLLHELKNHAPKLKAITEASLRPLAKQLNQIESTLKQMQAISTPRVIEAMQSEFEDTDFIAINNAGLVLLWPFLQRFFENLGLLTDKEFHNAEARNKAACVLQHLVEAADEELFEGQLPLNKVLCGIPLDEPVEPVQLTEDDKEMAEGLLQAVIARGPYWKNLTPAGLRVSYIHREGLLKSRDGHWLLQVSKQTYDITLEKLPWSFNAVKLPWMNEVLIVEWI